MVYGSRIAVTVGLASIVLATAIAVVVGSVAGYQGRRWDTVLMRVTEMFYAFPPIVGLIVIIVVLGRGIPTIVVALGLFGWATMARVLRASVLTIREAQYVEAARGLGATSWWVVTRHVLPNSLGPLLVIAVARGATAILALAGLTLPGDRARGRHPRLGRDGRRRKPVLRDPRLPVALPEPGRGLHRGRLRPPRRRATRRPRPGDRPPALTGSAERRRQIPIIPSDTGGIGRACRSSRRWAEGPSLLRYAKGNLCPRSPRESEQRRAGQPCTSESDWRCWPAWRVLHKRLRTPITGSPVAGTRRRCTAPQPDRKRTSASRQAPHTRETPTSGKTCGGSSTSTTLPRTGTSLPTTASG